MQGADILGLEARRLPHRSLLIFLLRLGTPPHDEYIVGAYCLMST